ncbi:hypothetical protein CBS101457_002692 [Exobasidium rhododendri]|nr:hypothetical protein CBS101457_002692 [Exobasidium rhododendri]
MPKARFRPVVYDYASSSSSTSRAAQSRFRSRSCSSNSSANAQQIEPLEDEIEADTTSGSVNNPDEGSATSFIDHGDVFMSICVNRERVGCAVYEFANGRLSLLEDCPIQTRKCRPTLERREDKDDEDQYETISENSPEAAQAPESKDQASELVSSMIQRFRPDLVLISKRCPDVVSSIIISELAKLSSVLQIRPAKEFNKDDGLARILDLRCRSSLAIRGASTPLYRASQITLSTLPLSVSAAHALLAHLERSSTLQQNKDSCDPQTTPTVTSIELIALSDTMFVSADTLKALCIFDEEDHAVSQLQRRKEGLSLFGIFDCIQTPTSRALLRRWLLFPSRSIPTLDARFDAVGLFLTDKTACRLLRNEIKGVKNIERLSSRLLDGNADLSTWKGISDFASRCLLIRRHCASIAEAGRGVLIVEKVNTIFTGDRLRQVRQSIEEVIDWDESRLSQRVSVRAGLDAQLDEWRQVYTNLPSILHSVALRLRDELGNSLHAAYHLYVEYFPQVGYLQALCRIDGRPSDENSIQAGEAMGWTYQYSSEIKAYFKTNETKDLDSQLGDLYSFIAGREVEMLQDLHERVAQHLSWLTACSEILAELDCLLAFAFVAAKNGYIRPHMIEEPSLDIREGRHPMQELIVEAYVPNSTALEGGRGLGVEVGEEEERYHSVTVVTGANACGKSIYLKQCALIVCMAQIGSFVPAESATIGVVDKIFTRMQAVESSSTMQSSFLIDMQQVSHALQSCTRHSLLLLDEMGKGTSSTDGASLFAATIRHLLARGYHCPRTLAATHFHEVFHPDLLPEELPFTPAHMQVLLGSDATRLKEDITFLYKLRYGLELTSHATQCEILCGVPPSVVERAAYVAQLSRDHNLGELQLRIQDAMQSQDRPRDDDKNSSQDLQWAERVARAFVQWDLNADEANAARNGEDASLDPLRRLSTILAGP